MFCFIKEKFEQYLKDTCGIGKKCAGAIFWFVVLSGFGISLLAIYSSGTSFPDGGECALPFEIANATTAHLEKSLISRWRWTYEDEDKFLKIRAMCPSGHQDADLFYDDMLIGRTQGEVFNVDGSFDVLDCNGEKLGKWSAGSFGQSLENQLTYQVNSYIEKDGLRIAYIKGENFVSTEIEIVDAETGILVAEMSRDVLTFSAWTWVIERHLPEHPAADWRFLMGIIGKESFAADPDSNCICNEYFFYLVYTLLACVCMTFCLLGCLCYAKGPREACETWVDELPCSECIYDTSSSCQSCFTSCTDRHESATNQTKEIQSSGYQYGHDEIELESVWSPKINFENEGDIEADVPYPQMEPQNQEVQVKNRVGFQEPKTGERLEGVIWEKDSTGMCSIIVLDTSNAMALGLSGQLLQVAVEDCERLPNDR